MTASPENLPEFDALSVLSDSNLSGVPPAGLKQTGANRTAALQLSKETLDNSLDIIDQFSGYERDWDSYDAPPFEPIVIERAKKLLTGLLLHGIPVPNLVPASSGSIIFDWRTREGHLEIDIDPEGDDVVYISGQYTADEIEYIGPLNEISNDHRRILNQVLCRLRYPSGRKTP